jgi:hypothetical protein
MIVKIFWQESCSRCPPTKELGKKLETEGVKVEYYDISTPDGLAEAMFHDVLSTPSLIIIDDKKKELAAWRGETPTVENMKKFLS